MKTILAALLLMLAGCVEARPEHSAPYAVRLEMVRGVCSGTAVGRDLILTASHCLEDGNRLTKINGTFAYALEVIHDGNDHALVRVSTQFTRWAVMGPAPEQGDRVTFNGNANGNPDMYREGYVVRVTDTETLLDLNAFGGDSGSGIFDGRGRLVAVVSDGLLWMRRTSAHHMALTVAYPLAFTDENWRDIRA